MKWTHIAGVILCMHPANEKGLYIVTSLIGWTHSQNDPCIGIWTGSQALFHEERNLNAIVVIVEWTHIGF